MQQCSVSKELASLTGGDESLMNTVLSNRNHLLQKYRQTPTASESTSTGNPPCRSSGPLLLTDRGVDDFTFKCSQEKRELLRSIQV